MSTYTYSGDPSASVKDQVRFLAQATGTDQPTGIVSDEEIAFLLTQEPNPYLAAAMVADRGAAYYGAQRTKTVGPLTISGQDQARSYAAMAVTLRSQASLWTNAGDSGPQWVGDNPLTEIFNIGMNDYPNGSFLAPSQNLLGGTP